MTDPYWTQIIAAILTPAIAFFGLLVAYRQWRTARKTLKTDRFVNTFAVYDAVRAVIASIMASDKAKEAAPDVEGLSPVANTNNANKLADVVFVHGLIGTSHGTWRYSQDGKPDHFFWPAEMGKDLPLCGIWTIGYPAGITVFGKPGMIIEKRAGNLAHKLANAGLGQRPVIFVTHSMGGLVVKSIIVGSQTLADPARKRLVRQIRGIVFCATPHRGSAFATAASVLGKHFGLTQEHVAEMQSHSDRLDILHDGFIEWHRSNPVPVLSYAENLGLFKTRWFLRPLPLGLVVPRSSANPGIAGHTMHDVDDSHITIVKPRNRKHDVYEGVLSFVNEALSQDSSTSECESPILFQASMSDIFKHAPNQLIGRKAQTQLLDDSWAKVTRDEIGRPHILTFVALGGEGKTSLVAKWVAELAHRNWPACDAAFAWSFYSQGAREQHATSSDLFLKEAISFFGNEADKKFANSNSGAFEKGQRLAHLLGQRRCLLILDGLEPLQHAPGAPTPGELKDQGVSALLRALATVNRGLCVVTTRYSILDLKGFWQTTAPEENLRRLSCEAGVHLLKSLGVRSESGTDKEFETLVEDVNGHALTLTLLGGFLSRAFHGDIRQRDRVKFEKADQMINGGHAFRTLSAYEDWLLSGGEEGRREVALLRLLGLFDRPADCESLAALRRETIPDLTEPLAGLTDEGWEFCISGLEAAKLLTVNRGASGALTSLDAHPLLREYFARQLQEQRPNAWCAAHKRLFEHLLNSTPDQSRPMIEDLHNIYQAVTHGCRAGLHRLVWNEVFERRLERDSHFATLRLGAVGSDLAALSCFFDDPWTKINDDLTLDYKAKIYCHVAFRLTAIGRLSEAIKPSEDGLAIDVKRSSWRGAAILANNLSELLVALGNIKSAIDCAVNAVTYARNSGDWIEIRDELTTYGDALHQAGFVQDAFPQFIEAESVQSKEERAIPVLHSLRGFKYCDLLLREAERAAWDVFLLPSAGSNGLRNISGTLQGACMGVIERAAKTLAWAVESDASLLTIALDHLTLGRSNLYLAILSDKDGTLRSSGIRDRADSIRIAREETDVAVAGLRRAGQQQYLPHGLITRAWLRFLENRATGSDSAQSDLDEAWEIAQRGSMKLFVADIHLCRARLFLRHAHYPWTSPKDDLAAAHSMINLCGYGRRKEEIVAVEDLISS